MALLPILVVAAAGAFAFGHLNQNLDAVRSFGERLGGANESVSHAISRSISQALPGASGSESEPGLAAILAVLKRTEPEKLDEWKTWEKPRLIREISNPASQQTTQLWQTGPRGPRAMPDWVAAPTMRETTIGPGGGVIHVYYQDTRI